MDVEDKSHSENSDSAFQGPITRKMAEDAWKNLPERDWDVPPDESQVLRKQFVAVASKVDVDERTVTAVISTSTVDRDGEVLQANGAILDSYLKNPVVLWAHDYFSAPIGKAQWVTKGRGKITAKVQFAETQQAQEVFELFKGGFLNAFSVGFRPLKSHAPTPDEIKKKPEWANAWRIFDEWELLEFSPVPVPANPEALMLAVKSKDITLSDENRKAFGFEDEDEEETTQIAEPAVYADTDLAPAQEETKIFDVELDVEVAEIDVRPAVIVVEEAPLSIRGGWSVWDSLMATVGKMKGKVT